MFKKLLVLYFIIFPIFSLSAERILLNDDVSAKEISGIVLDEFGDPIPGVSIQIKGGREGTISTLEGEFTLMVNSEDDVLLFSFLGFKTLEVSVASGDYKNLRMKPDVLGLDEVVVSGVASNTPTKKLTVTVAKVNEEALNKAPATSVATALQGKVAGVQITQAYGTPGSGASVRLRGSTSLTGNQSPMLMVDGNILQGSLADINVDDIASMEVVKGAAAAALYGSRAGSGVIVITTKRGRGVKNKRSEITFRNEYGQSSLVKQIDLATHHPYVLADDYADYTTFTKYDGVRYSDDGDVVRGARKLQTSHYADQPYGVLRDNQSQFFSPGQYYTNYVSVANRGEFSNVFLSFENNKQEGVVSHTDGYHRKNFRVNVDMQVTDRLKLSTSNLIVDATSDNPGSTGAFFDLLFLSPDTDLEQTNDDGSPYKIEPDPWSLEENPIYPLYYRERVADRNSVMSNIIADYQLFDFLSFKLKYTFENLEKHWSTYTPRGYLYGGGSEVAGGIYKEQYSDKFQTLQYTANFNKMVKNFTFKGKVSYLYENEEYNDFSAKGNDFVAADIPQLNNTDQEKASINSYNGSIRSENIFGILDFDYKSKYLFSILYRMDGSSLFGAEERWNPYYRASAAYRITEDFKIPGVDELKIRIAQGTSGQRPGFSNQYETWALVNGNLQKSALGNEYLKPSESTETELALDMNFLSRFSLTASYSNTTTRDVIVQAPVASQAGYSYQYQNVGTINSNSYEIALNADLIHHKNFSWTAGITSDKVTQVISELRIPEYKTGPNNAFLIAEGETFGSFYGYKWLRSLDDMANQLTAGDAIENYTINSEGYVIEAGTEGSADEMPIEYDANGDGVADLDMIGDGNPDFRMALTSTLTWRWLSAYILFDWKQGGDIYNYTHQYTFRDNMAIEFDQFGIPDENKKTIDYYSAFYRNTTVNDYFVEDGSFVKLRELSLYATFNAKDLGVLGQYVKLVKIGAIGRNLFTWTNYSGYDPEVASGSDLTNYPFDNFGYPNYRTVSGSLTVKF